MQRGQVSIPFIILISVITVLVLFMFGGKIYHMFSTLGCQVDEGNFAVALEKLSLSQSTSEGSVDIESIRVPCGIEKIFFFDRSGNVLFDGFGDLPDMQDSIKSNAKDNVFLVKDEQIYQSMFIPRIGITLPYFTCVNTGNGQLEVDAENYMDKTFLLPANAASDCTYDYIVPLELDLEDALFVLKEIFLANQSRLNDSIVDPLSVNLTKKVFIDGEWTVINVSKTQGAFDYFEYIPKCAMESFVAAQDNGFIDLGGAAGFQNLSDDPLIMWEFDEDDEQSIQYKLKSLLDPDCLRDMRTGLYGVGLANTSYPGLSSGEINATKAERRLADTNVYEMLTSLNFIGAKEVVKQYEEDCSAALDVLAKEIRMASIPADKKLNLVEKITIAKQKLLTSPPMSISLLDTVDFVLTGLGLGTLMDSDEIERCRLGAEIAQNYLVELNLISGNIPLCSTSGSGAYVKDSCDDGVSGLDDYCVDATKYMQVGCDGTSCEYNLQVCGAGEKCENGRCTSTSTTCEDDDGASWRNAHIREWDIVQIGTTGVDLCVMGGNPGCIGATTMGGDPIMKYVGERVFIGDEFLDDNQDLAWERYIDNDGEVCVRSLPALSFSDDNYTIQVTDPTGTCSLVIGDGGPYTDCCSSSDSEKGILESGTQADFCINSSKVEEDVCYDDVLITESIDCPVGYVCDSGACIPFEDTGDCTIDLHGEHDVPECFEDGDSKKKSTCNEEGGNVIVRNVYCKPHDDHFDCDKDVKLTVGDDHNCECDDETAKCENLADTIWPSLSAEDKTRYSTLIVED
ncbi:hypothetical protein H6504_05445 [Candidatus Woesearchaeota archaeon]|nr:hypothetical protein [Candidatus Woesearchaeota archaeon]